MEKKNCVEGRVILRTHYKVPNFHLASSNLWNDDGHIATVLHQSISANAPWLSRGEQLWFDLNVFSNSILLHWLSLTRQQEESSWTCSCISKQQLQIKLSVASLKWTTMKKGVRTLDLYLGRLMVSRSCPAVLGFAMQFLVASLRCEQMVSPAKWREKKERGNSCYVTTLIASFPSRNS